MAPIPAAAPQDSKKEDSTPLGTVASTGRFLIGTVLLLVAVGSSAVLSFQQISRANIPGCGPGSACGELAKSVWGKVPIVDWPVSFLGLAFFTAMLVAWIVVRGQARSGGALRWLIRAGGLASLVFTGVMVTKGLICPYCLAAHIANLSFVAMVEVTSRKGAQVDGAGSASGATGASPRGAWRWQGASAVTTVFLAATLTIAVVDQQAARSAGEQQESDFAASMQALLGSQDDTSLIASGPAEAQTRSVNQTVEQPRPPEQAITEPDPNSEPQIEPSPEPTPQPTPAPTPAPTPTPPPAAPAATPSTATAPPSAPAREPFTGRYRWGPERASIRIVMFTGYQCPDCRTMDTQIKQVLARWPDLVSFSIKHFPLSNQCNPHMPEGPQGNMHPNACWAARAAETAGIIAGRDGFVRMHEWLYSQGGSFTDSSLPPALSRLGFDVNQFLAIMQSPEPLRLVQADIEEGMKYGLSQTPMIFINGTELKGWRAQNALVRAVEAVAANPPPARTADRDHPLGAVDKALADWREQRKQSWPSRTRSWGLGPENATVQIQLFGDVLEANTAKVHQAVMTAIQGRDDIRYEFRYFPFDQSCNPTLPRTGVPQGCRAAYAVEAAGQLGGEQAYWRMHEWLMANQSRFSDQALRDAAAGMGIMADPLFAFMQAPQVTEAIEQDVSITNRLGEPRMPRLHINGRLVPRWEIPGEQVLDLIINEAAVGEP